MDPKIQRNHQKDQRGYIGGEGGALRVPSRRGKSLKSWCVENTALLQAWQSYKAGKLLIASGRHVDECPVVRV